jgi:hypothetical protein
MKVFFHYSTHDDPSQNNWFILGEENTPEKASDTISPWNGEEAYLKRIKYPPVEYCVITLQPASKNKYFLIISTADGLEQIMTYRQYEWEEAIAHASLLKEQSFKAAQRILKSKKL